MDPATGEVVEDVEQFNLMAGIEQIGITEEGGVGETRDIKLYIKHGTNGLPYECTTGDRIEYKGRTWKVTVVDPEFTSKDSIASCINNRGCSHASFSMRLSSPFPAACPSAVTSFRQFVSRFFWGPNSKKL